MHFLIVFLSFLSFTTGANRSFTINYDLDTFVKDGKPFRFYSGAFHHFRSPPEFWPSRLKGMKYGGMDAVETYLEWATLEPVKGQYDFTGINDFVHFCELAQQTDLLVILRPGPYICAERDLGGFPAWLQWEHPKIKYRYHDKNYMKEVKQWWNVLMPKIKPLLYSNGGPVIMVQVENEYGTVDDKNRSQEYKLFMRDITRKHLGEDIVLFTVDGNYETPLIAGKIPDVLPTGDFGVAEKADELDKFVKIFRSIQPKGPLMNSEYYIGWLDYWSEKHSKMNLKMEKRLLEDLEKLSKYNYNINFYMYVGGTNFDFSPGAGYNRFLSGSDKLQYQPDPTSYDYDAPISEGGKLTPKWYLIRNFILEERKRKNIPVSDIESFDPAELETPALDMGKVEMKAIGNIFDKQFQNFSREVSSKKPLSFDKLKHAYGFVLYSTILPQTVRNYTMVIRTVFDRALVYLNSRFIGKLSRTLGKNGVTLNITEYDLMLFGTQKLSILVENQGRINVPWNFGEDKGILSPVLMNGKEQTGWKMQTLYEDWTALANFADNQPIDPRKSLADFRFHIPTFMTGQFVVPEDHPELFGTHLSFRPGNWHKGVVLINGHNMGRYWPHAGPQNSLYIPSTFLRPFPQKNSIVMLELEDITCWGHSHGCWVRFTAEPDIDSDVHPD